MSAGHSKRAGSSVPRGIDLRNTEMRCTTACCGRLCFWKEITTVARTQWGLAIAPLQAAGSLWALSMS